MVFQELLRHNYESLLAEKDEVLGAAVPDSEDAELVLEFAYALRLALADKFSVMLHDAEVQEPKPDPKDPGQQTIIATLGSV